jgi:hypothetical protein
VEAGAIEHQEQILTELRVLSAKNINQPTQERNEYRFVCVGLMQGHVDAAIGV